MSWSYLPEQGAESTEACCSDTLPSALWNSLTTTGARSCSASATEYSRGSQCGTTCAHSTAGHGADMSTSCQEDSPARTSAPPAKAPESTARNPDSGERWRASFARFDRVTCSWRTVQCYLFEDSEQCSVIWPRSGMTVGGHAYPLPTVGRRTSGTESGFLPTPTKTDANGRTYHYGRGRKENATCSLLGVAKLLPTPAATDWKGQYTWDTVRKRMAMTRGVRLPEELVRVAGKAITPNPDFWDWMMGWPIGSSALQPLEMDRFREFVQQHGGF